jgi:hypothetical protein
LPGGISEEQSVFHVPLFGLSVHTFDVLGCLRLEEGSGNLAIVRNQEVRIPSWFLVADPDI